MAKKSNRGELPLPPREAGQAAGSWLHESLRAAILDGRLGPSARLPASRALAEDYGIARSTVVGVFEQLRSEGYLDASGGSGTYVAQRLPDSLLEAPALRAATSPYRLAAAPRRPARLSSFARRLVEFENFAPGRSRAFQANRPALDLFPVEEWARTAARVAKGATSSMLLGCGPLGYEPLREAISAYLGESRGVRCEAGQIAVVAGVQGGLDLAAKLLLEPGSLAVAEDPGYPGARLAFEACGAEVRPLPVDGRGAVIRDGSLHGAALAYVTPAHQFPTCVAMDIERRRILLESAARAGAFVFEDDYDSEFRFVGRPLPALQGLDDSGSVIFAGSFSKVLFPSLRLGYLVLPPDLVDPAAAALSLSVRHAPLLDQAALADYIDAGAFGRHVRRMRSIYAERHGLLKEGSLRYLEGLIELSPVEAGLQTAAWLRVGLSDEQAAAIAGERGVEVIPISRYARRPLLRQGLLLGFASVGPEAIERGCRELASALELLANHA